MGKQFLLASAGALLLVGVFLLGFVKATRATRCVGVVLLVAGAVGLAAYFYIDVIAPGLVDREQEVARKAVMEKVGKAPQSIELKMKWPPRTPNIRDFYGVARVDGAEWGVWVVRKDVAGTSDYWTEITPPASSTQPALDQPVAQPTDASQPK